MGAIVLAFLCTVQKKHRGRADMKQIFFKQTPNGTTDETSLFKVSVSSNVIVDTLNVAIVVTLIRVV